MTARKISEDGAERDECLPNQEHATSVHRQFQTRHAILIAQSDAHQRGGDADIPQHRACDDKTRTGQRRAAQAAEHPQRKAEPCVAAEAKQKCHPSVGL